MSRKMLLVILVVAALGGGGWYFFMASDADKEQATRRALSAAYDVKAAANLAADAVKPGEVMAGTNSPEAAAQCRANIRSIEMAKRAAASKKGLTTGHEVRLPDILAEMNLEELPKCPAGGSYRIRPVGTVVQCSIGSGILNDDQDDHFVNNF